MVQHTDLLTHGNVDAIVFSLSSYDIELDTTTTKK